MEAPKTLKDMSVEELKALGYDIGEQLGQLQQQGKILANQAMAVRQEIAGRPASPLAVVDTELKD